MRRIIALVSALVLLFGMVSCGGGDEAFEVSKSAYEKVNKAYEMVNMYSEDIYQAWYMGINDKYDSIVTVSLKILPKNYILKKTILKML